MARRARVSKESELREVPLIRPWLLRIFVTLGRQRDFAQYHDFTDDALQGVANVVRPELANIVWDQSAPKSACVSTDI